jgi:hypothetical protein
MSLRSIVYGYLGSAAAGLAVAAIGMSAGLTEEAVVAIASPAGMVCGLMGFAYAWRDQAASLVRAAASRYRR